jgi:phosphoglycolate phosphatase
MNTRESSSPCLAVFDCDGTLVDSQHNIVAAMTEAWRAFGLEPLAGAEVRRVVGLPLVDAIAVLFPDGERRDHIALSDLYKDAFRALRHQPDHHEPLYPGAVETLDDLEADGVLLAVATGKSRRGLVATLDRHGLAERFTVLKTADDAPGKPNPDMLLAAMSETGASPDSTVMIGDTVFDIEMAVNARIPAIGVSWGYHDPVELVSAGANEIVDRFGDVVHAAAALWRDGDATR